MASLVVVSIILGCAAFQYFKGTIIKAFATIIIAICAGMVAFGFFEFSANLLISRGDSGILLSIAPWAQTLCFILIFVVVFALLQTGATYLLRHPVDLGFLPERIGSVICGLILGLIVSGLLLTALAMGPLSLSYPYKRFDPMRLKPDAPDKALLNVDGFATGLFSMVSKGSFRGKRSFATIHPNYLDQLFLNRLINTDSTSIISNKFPAISVPRPPKHAVWPASKAISDQVDGYVDQLKRQAGKIKYDPDQPSKSVPLPVSTKGSYDPTIVRVGIKKTAIRGNAKINGGAFTPSQLRLICKRKGYGQDPLAGNAINAYPIGYLKSADQMQISPEIKLSTQDIEGSEKFIDFVFCLPSGFEPVLVEYKLNSIVEILPRAILTDISKAPEPATFSPSSGDSRNRSNRKQNRPSGPAQQQQQTETSPDGRGLSDTSKSILGPGFDEE